MWNSNQNNFWHPRTNQLRRNLGRFNFDMAMFSEGDRLPQNRRRRGGVAGIAGNAGQQLNRHCQTNDIWNTYSKIQRLFHDRAGLCTSVQRSQCNAKPAGIPPLRGKAPQWLLRPFRQAHSNITLLLWTVLRQFPVCWWPLSECCHVLLLLPQHEVRTVFFCWISCVFRTRSTHW